MMLASCLPLLSNITLEALASEIRQEKQKKMQELNIYKIATDMILYGTEYTDVLL